MPAVGYFMDLSHARVLLLLLVGGMGDRPRDGVVVLAGDDQQRSALGILRVDLGFRPRVDIGGGCLEDRHAGARYRVFLVQFVRLTLVYGVGEGVTELLVGQWDGAGVVEGIAQDRRRRLQRREWQGEHATERRGVDGDCHGGHALPGYLLRDEPAEGMADDGGLRLELVDGIDIVIRDLLDALVGEDLRVLLGLLNAVRIIRPARRECGVAPLFEQLAPVVPTAGEEPEAMYEHDRLLSLRVGAVDLLLFMNRQICHVVLLWVCMGKLFNAIVYYILHPVPATGKGKRRDYSVRGGPVTTRPYLAASAVSACISNCGARYRGRIPSKNPRRPPGRKVTSIFPVVNERQACDTPPGMRTEVPVEAVNTCSPIFTR